MNSDLALIYSELEYTLLQANLAGIQHVNRPEILHKTRQKRSESRNLHVLMQTDLLEEAMGAGLTVGIYMYIHNSLSL